MREGGVAGIDVAFAKGKPLPIVVCRTIDGVVEPLPLKRAQATPPIGLGNVRALDEQVRAAFAEETTAYLHAIEAEFDLHIERIAIDAPSDQHVGERRACEEAIRQSGIRYFKTPNRARFDEICDAARAHIAAGKPEPRIPASNLIWMLVGFSLFERLRHDWNCVFEVFPHAIAWKLGVAGLSKKTPEGQRARLVAVSAYTHWPLIADPAVLEDIAYGDRHDRLDAYLAAWIASLPENKRDPAGVPPNDVIWLPGI